MDTPLKMLISALLSANRESDHIPSEEGQPCQAYSRSMRINLAWIASNTASPRDLTCSLR
jgi:hypothetical protein